MIKVGITGGIGGGKSTFSQLLREKGFLVYDTDKEAARLQNTDTTIIDEIINVFGTEAYTNHQLNRRFIADIVFSDERKLEILNGIVHPRVKADLIQWFDQNKDQSVLFVECAILYEGGFDQLTDKNILVTAPESIRIKRVEKRDSLSPDKVQKRINRQIKDEVKMRKANIIVDTEFGLNSQVVQSVLNQLCINR